MRAGKITFRLLQDRWRVHPRCIYTQSIDVHFESIQFIFRYDSNSRQYHHPVPGQQWAGICHVSTPWSTLLPDPAYGPRRQERGIVETAGLCRLGT